LKVELEYCSQYIIQLNKFTYVFHNIPQHTT